MQNDMQQTEAVEMNGNDNANVTSSAGEFSEAIQAAVHSVQEKKTKRGRVRGNPSNKQATQEDKANRLTAKQALFVQGILAGKTKLQAYKDAYDVRTTSDAVCSVSASELMKNPKITKHLGGLEEVLKERVIEEAAKTRRFVMERLHDRVMAAKTEATELKALELMGKAVGMFTDRVEQTVEQVNPEKLKEELKSSLKLLDNVAPIKKRDA